MTPPLISVRGLETHYPLGRALFGTPPVLKALAGIDLDIPKGSFFGLVGESGSGKTTLGRAILKAAPISQGTIPMTTGRRAMTSRQWIGRRRSASGPRRN